MIDLHMHSIYSDDGELEPFRLVELCSEASVTIMSITDHNCAKANEPAEAKTNANGILYIPGIEIDCVFKNTGFHVLGYGIDYKSRDFETIEQNIAEQSYRASLEKLALTQALGFSITEDDMREMSEDRYWKQAWTGEMFAEVLLSRPEYSDHPLLNPYRPGGSRSDNPYVNFYWDYYSQGKPCFVKIEFPSMEQITEIIHANHGLAVLAHPGINLKGKMHLLDDILQLVDGVEAFSSYHTQAQAEFFAGKARERRLIITCGSDYHGKIKPAIRIGEHHCTLPADELQKQLIKTLKTYGSRIPM